MERLKLLQPPVTMFPWKITAVYEWFTTIGTPAPAAGARTTPCPRAPSSTQPTPPVPGIKFDSRNGSNESILWSSV